MAKTRREKIEDIRAQKERLANREKVLLQAERADERKARTKRLCRRMGLFESMMPDTVALTEEQFKTFLEKTMLTAFTRRILDELAAQVGTPATEKPAATAQVGAEKNEGNGAKATG